MGFYDKSGKQRTNFCYDKVIMASKGDDLVCFNGLGLVVKDGKFAYLNENYRKWFLWVHLIQLFLLRNIKWEL